MAFKDRLEKITTERHEQETLDDLQRKTALAEKAKEYYDRHNLGEAENNQPKPEAREPEKA